MFFKSLIAGNDENQTQRRLARFDVLEYGVCLGCCGSVEGNRLAELYPQAIIPWNA